MNNEEFNFILISEEAIEVSEAALNVAKLAIKCNRFGPNNDAPFKLVKNVKLLEQELIDLEACIRNLEKLNIDLSGRHDEERINLSWRKKEYFNTFSKELKRLNEQ